MKAPNAFEAKRGQAHTVAGRLRPTGVTGWYLGPTNALTLGVASAPWT